MTTTSPDDDRTVIRPQAPLLAPLASAAEPGADDDRTVIRAGAVAASRPEAPTTEPASPAARAMPAMVTSMPSPGANPAGPPDTGNALPVGTRLGEFEITGVVGEGGFGIVYLAHDHSLGRRVAVKEYMPAALAARAGATTVQVRNERHRETFEAGMRSFVNEARLLAQFDHPAMVKVYRFWEANGTAYMVMPFYEGDTFKDRLAALPGPPDEDWLLGLLDPLTSALSVLHDEHCYHRDIAPDNILLLRGDKPLLLDFGAARRVIGDLTQALTVILKSGYAPVEQYAEVPGMKQGPWTDVYALAASIYYAIERRTPPPSVGRMVKDSFVPLAQSQSGRYGARFLAAIDAALAVHPDQRIPDMRALRAALGFAEPANGATLIAGAAGPTGIAAAAPGLASAARVAAGPQVTPPSTRVADRTKSRLPVLLGAGALVAAVVGGGFFFVTRPPVPALASVAAPVAAAPEPVPAAVFDPTAAARAVVERIIKGATPGFAVEVRTAKPTLRMDSEGDMLAFSVKAERKGAVYAWVARPDGSFVQIAPGASRGAPNRERMLPAGEVWAWPLDWLDAGAPSYRAHAPGGRSKLLVVISASARRIDGARWGEDFGELPAPAAGEEAASIAAVLLGEPVCPAGKPCDASYGAAVLDIDEI
ncbi:serine/threonine protein kinase [Derxia gummosa]|uniref:Serine/threonine protein kinase n=1 Tax=Derxia gummosa DSM 723 TaxID=1121388 RepID=A0A9U5D289_9BURK|nr:serine/threonine protein kinase [Derxia gummosa]